MFKFLMMTSWSMLNKKRDETIRILAFFIRDESGKIVGGCSGDNVYGSHFVGSLWVTEKLRGQGHGTNLMKAAEKLAKESDCNFMAVNTMD